MARRREYIEKEIEEMKSDENRWFAGEALGHEPSDEEAAEYYVNCGAAEEFNKKCGHLLCECGQ